MKVKESAETKALARSIDAWLPGMTDALSAGVCRRIVIAKVMETAIFYAPAGATIESMQPIIDAQIDALLRHYQLTEEVIHPQ